MDFDGLIGSRRSVRQFIQKEVPDSLLLKLLEAAHWAPSAGNVQPWHFYVVKSGRLKQGLCERAYLAEWLPRAPVVIAVCIDIKAVMQRYGQRGKELYSIQDTAAATQNILLSAKGNGLGACWIGAFDEEACKEVLGIEDNLRPVALIAVGYPANEPPARERRPVSEIATFLYDKD